MKLATSSSMTIAAGIFIGMVALAIAVLFPSRNVRATPVALPSVAPSTCSCSGITVGGQRSVYNCQCGTLQCVFTSGDQSPASPVAMACVGSGPQWSMPPR